MTQATQKARRVTHGPPEHLSERSKALWLKMVPKQGRGAARLALLRTALECLDRADEAREAIAKAGMTTVTEKTGAVHVHPLVRVEKESRQQFMKCWGMMGLSHDW